MKRTGISRRMFWVLILITLCFGSLLYRLASIQVFQTHDFSRHNIDLVARAERQREQEWVADIGRGAIQDRNGEPITGQSINTLVMFPVARKGVSQTEKGFTQLAGLLGVSPDEIQNRLNQIKSPTVWEDEDTHQPVRLTDAQMNEINQLSIYGVVALPYTNRYPSDMLARHVVGFISQDPDRIRSEYGEALKEGKISLSTPVGGAGLEKAFDPLLLGVGETSLIYTVDGEGNPLYGLSQVLKRPDNPYYPLSLVTTLDLSKQRLVEEAMDQAGIKTGAAVLLDANNGDILAMASRPNFNPNQLDLTHDAWRNRALQQTVPGSIFKTVIAAAALQEGLVSPEEVFTCNGALGKYDFSCWKTDGHGPISFAQAYAQSCNITFAETAMRINGDVLEDYARRLGITVTPGWKADALFKLPHFSQLDHADAGEVFASATPKNDEGVLVQTSIGQRDVRMSPLQAANMVVTIIQNGKRFESRLVSRITYKNGVLMKAFPVQAAEGETINPETAAELREMMRLVVTDGTGQKLETARWPIAGKSGTAQVRGGRINQWFTGYAPYASPRYALAVVAEDLPGSTQENLAIEAFQKIMDALAGME